MAITKPPNWDFNPYEDFKFTYKDIPIGGKLVRGTIRVPEHKMMYAGHEFKQYLKNSMATQLVEYMISNGLVEFTQMRDNITTDTLVNARCYLAPNDEVKILRMHYNDT